MKSKNKKGVVTTAPSIREVRGDLAVLSKEMFLKEYGCSSAQYNRMLEQFGTEELISFLRHLLKQLITNEIECEPAELKRLVIDSYNKRIIKLCLYEYEKNNLCVCNFLGFA